MKMNGREFALATFHGPLAMWALVLVTQSCSRRSSRSALRASGPLRGEGSGLLNMVIAGGALVLAQGWKTSTACRIPSGCSLRILHHLLRTVGSKPTAALPPKELA